MASLSDEGGEKRSARRGEGRCGSMSYTPPGNGSNTRRCTLHVCSCE